jgi:hypothetical protein
MMAQYPAAVRSLWPDEERIARAYLADASAVPLSERNILNDDALSKDRTLQEHCEIIVLKADNFRAIGIATRRLFLATEHALNAAASSDDMEEVLDLAKVTASALATTYGLTVNPE